MRRGNMLAKLRMADSSNVSLENPPAKNAHHINDTTLAVDGLSVEEELLHANANFIILYFY